MKPLLRLSGYLLAAMFLYAGINKAIDPTAFMHQMQESPLIPDGLIPIIAYGLPLTEILLAVAIFFGLYPAISFQLACSIMLFFTVYLIMLKTLYTKAPCACGGILGSLDYPAHIAFNIVFTLIAFVCWQQHKAQITSGHESV